MSRNLSVIILIAFLFACFSLSAVAEDEPQPPQQPKSAVDVLPFDTLIAIEFDMNKIRAVSKDKPLSVINTFFRRIMLAELRKDTLPEIFDRLWNLPYVSRSAFGFVMPGAGEPQPVLVMRVSGSAERALQELFAGSDWAVNRTDMADLPTWNLAASQGRIKFCAAGEYILTGRTEAIMAVKTTIDNPEMQSFGDSEAWNSLEPRDDETLARGVLDIMTITGLVQPVKQMLSAFGIGDATTLAATLKYSGGQFVESFKLNSFAQFTTPAFELAGTGPVPTENSAIPDTAVLAARMSLNFSQMWQWIANAVPALPGGAEFTSLADPSSLEPVGALDPQDFCTALGTRVEFFADYPEGAVLPDYCVSVDLRDPASIETLLGVFATNTGMIPVEREGVSAFVVAQSDLHRDFPWGVALFVRDGRLVLCSNLDAAIAALDRAKTAKLVDTQKFKSNSMPSRRSLELFIDGKAFTALGNLLRAAMPGQKALYPAGDKLADMPHTFISLGGDEQHLELSSSGTMTLGTLLSLLAISEPFEGLARSFDPGRIIEGNLIRLHRLCREYYRQNNVMPVTLGDLVNMEGFSARLVVLPGRETPGNVTAEWIDQNTNLVYIMGLDLKVDRHNRLPLIITRKPVGGNYHIVFCNGSSSEVAPRHIDMYLDRINRELATNYRIEGVRIIGP
ncbi:MAG: hypothetical protein U5N86_06275 [Planctomycetota bacterium]|nr:hypothetical protein [Planctomycetota bacterium]